MSPHYQPMLPTPYWVAGRRVETQDSVTLQLASVSQRLPEFRPGQFSMPYAHGIGEVPISISGDPSAMDGSLMQTNRDLGAVNRAGGVLGAV